MVLALFCGLALWPCLVALPCGLALWSCLVVFLMVLSLVLSCGLTSFPCLAALSCLATLSSGNLIVWSWMSLVFPCLVTSLCGLARPLDFHYCFYPYCQAMVSFLSALCLPFGIEFWSCFSIRTNILFWSDDYVSHSRLLFSIPFAPCCHALVSFLGAFDNLHSPQIKLW